MPASGVDLVLLLDVSRSMEAADVAPSRLARSRRTAIQVLRRLGPGDRAALAAFAGNGALLTPLTTDHDALAEMVPALDAQLMSDKASRIGKGLEAALSAFAGQAPRPRVLLLLSDGEGPSSELEAALDDLVRAEVRSVTVAVGTRQGAPIPADTAAGSHGTFLHDAFGEEVISRLRLATLERIAQATSGTLLRTDAWGDVDPDVLVAELRRGAEPLPDGTLLRTVPATRERIPALLALALLLGEGLLPIRRWPRTSLPRARRQRRAAAGVAAVAVLALLGLGASAPDPGTPLPRWAHRSPPATAAELLRLGLGRAQRAEWSEAERAFLAAAVRAHSPSLAGLAYFDLGVAALARGDLAAARDAFFDSLAVDPHQPQAKANLEWTLLRLSRKPPSRGAPPPKPGSAQPEPGPTPKPQRAAPPPGPRSAPQARPAPHPQPAPGTRRSVSSPPALSPEEVQRWLDAVEEDPRPGLLGAARATSPAALQGPQW